MHSSSIIFPMSAEYKRKYKSVDTDPVLVKSNLTSVVSWHLKSADIQKAVSIELKKGVRKTIGIYVFAEGERSKLKAGLKICDSDGMEFRYYGAVHSVGKNKEISIRISERHSDGAVIMDEEYLKFDNMDKTLMVPILQGIADGLREDVVHRVDPLGVGQKEYDMLLSRGYSRVQNGGSMLVRKYAPNIPYLH